MAAAAFLGFFAGLYHWFPKMTGRNYNHALAKIHFWGSVLPITWIFCGMLLQGWAGMHRRIYDHNVYTYLQHLRPITENVSWAAFLLGFFQLFFVVNFFRSWFAGSRAEANPWELGTLEWSTASPPVHHNFDHIPVVFRGPHEFNNPKYGNLGRDWIAQWETHPADESAQQRIERTHTHAPATVH
jgi:cytochrome c oxidase subunit 1